MKMEQIAKIISSAEAWHRHAGDNARADGLQKLANLLASTPDMTVTAWAKAVASPKKRSVGTAKKAKA